MNVGSTVVFAEPGRACIGEEPPRTFVQLDSVGYVSIKQDADWVSLSPDEAEALFLVLDTMLHPDDAGVDPEFDEISYDLNAYGIPIRNISTTE